MKEQTLCFAAICQIARFVQQVSRQGQLDDDQLANMLNSVVITSPENTLAVYGGNVAHLKTGLEIVCAHLGNHSGSKDPELTRYIVGMLNLERRLTKKPNNLDELAKRIDATKRQIAHYDITSDILLGSFAGIYSDVVSPLGPRIQVAGEPDMLKQTINQHKIRALLLAGIRATVLWRQVGGKRRNILFSRKKMLSSAQQLLGQI
jgi:high frequency lysogenization protein